MKALLYENEVVDCWRAEIAGADHISIAVALVTVGGLAEIRAALRGHLNRARRCQFLVGVDLPSQPEALAELITLAGTFPSFTVCRFQSSAGRIFHPKLGVFHRRGKATHAILGSSNMTRRTFMANCEANVFIDDRNTAGALADYFEELWIGAYAKQLDAEWLRGYQSIWRRRVAVEERTEELREQITKIGKKRAAAADVPHRIEGHRFAFTGGITDWPRSDKLYPEVRKLGGAVVTDADRLKSGDCLVHGNVLGESRTTLKLRAARGVGVSIITVDEFFAIRDQELVLRKRSRVTK